MPGRKRRALPADLSRAAERFKQWRRTRGRGERIPARLWSLAAARGRPSRGQPHGGGAQARVLRAQGAADAAVATRRCSGQSDPAAFLRGADAWPAVHHRAPARSSSPMPSDQRFGSGFLRATFRISWSLVRSFRESR